MNVLFLDGSVRFVKDTIDRAVLSLATEVMPAIAGVFQFSPDGHGLAWANSDGTVDWAELNEIQGPVKTIGRKP